MTSKSILLDLSERNIVQYKAKVIITVYAVGATLKIVALIKK